MYGFLCKGIVDSLVEHWILPQISKSLKVTELEFLNSKKFVLFFWIVSITFIQHGYSYFIDAEIEAWKG